MAIDPHTRRKFMKKASAATGTGALGTLAGCGGGSDGDGEGGGATDTDGDADADETPTPETGDGGTSETAKLRFLSGLAAESSIVRDHFSQELGRFEEIQGNVTVNLTRASYGDLAEKISTAVKAGDPPDLAESGSAGIEFFLDDMVVDHGALIEEAENIPEKWTQATIDAARFQGEWWATGQNRHNVTLLTVRPKLFKEVGVESPDDIATWTDFRRAVDQIHQENSDVVAYEMTGAFFDLEAYWGEARTAWTEGRDPWFNVEDMNPWEDVEGSLRVGADPRTDGMIKNAVDMSHSYSSPEAAQRTDEEIPPLMLTDQIASMPSGLGTAQRWKQVKEDVVFGWDGDVWMGPHPRLDANYGDEFGIDELAGHKGQHGGHAWALLMQKQIFKDSAYPNLAWELAKFTNLDEEFILPLVGEKYTAIPSYQPYMKRVVDEYDPVQIHAAQIEAAETYGPQYKTTGAAWDLETTDPIRWTDLSETISEAIAGQHTIDETPGLIRERILDRTQG